MSNIKPYAKLQKPVATTAKMPETKRSNPKAVDVAEHLFFESLSASTLKQFAIKQQTTSHHKIHAPGRGFDTRTLVDRHEKIALVFLLLKFLLKGNQ